MWTAKSVENFLHIDVIYGTSKVPIARLRGGAGSNSAAFLVATHG